MNKARVLGQFTRQLRIIAHIEFVERPRQQVRILRARRALAQLRRQTHISDALYDRLRRDVITKFARR